MPTNEVDSEIFDGMYHCSELRIILFSAFEKFSNLFKCYFYIDNLCFNSVEQAIQVFKAKYFGDKKMAKIILNTNTPLQSRLNGKKIKTYDFRIWNRVYKNVLRKCLYAKFTQNPELKFLLLQTSGWYLAYADTADLLYGTGKGKFDENAYNDKKWKGNNVLGKELIKLRRYFEIISPVVINESK